MANIIKKDWYTEAELASTTAPSGASLIGIEDTGGYFTGTDVEAALQELGAGGGGGGSASYIYMFSGTNSSITGYEQMVSLPSYAAGALATKALAATTTPQVIEEFATNIGFPNVTVIPAGTCHFHWEVQKSAGSNNYYTYAEVYKRVLAGTETLIATSDNSAQSALNTLLSVDVTATLASDVTLLSTDRLVVKVYGVMVSSTATLTLNYDDTTNARFEFPSVPVDATNFVPYTGATLDVDLGSKNITTTGTATIGTGVMTGRFQNDKGADVSAAGDLTLGSDGNFFKITGNTTINAITTTNWQAGSEVTLWFTGTPTISHNTAGGASTAKIQLEGAVNMSAEDGAYLTLTYNGTDWVEQTRRFP